MSNARKAAVEEVKAKMHSKFDPANGMIMCMYCFETVYEGEGTICGCEVSMNYKQVVTSNAKGLADQEKDSKNYDSKIEKDDDTDDGVEVLREQFEEIQKADAAFKATEMLDKVQELYDMLHAHNGTKFINVISRMGEDKDKVEKFLTAKETKFKADRDVKLKRYTI